MSASKFKIFLRKKRKQAVIISKALSMGYFYKFLLLLVIIEFFIMLMLHYVNLDTRLLEPLIDAGLLALIGFPFLLRYVIKPFSQDMNSKVAHALDETTLELKQLNDSLEQKVLQKTHEVTQRNEELQAILNVEKNIIIYTNGKKIIDVNRSFFNFFTEYKNLKEFNKEHDCICDFFQKRENDRYVYKDIDNMLWTEYILLHQDKNLKIAIQREDGIHFFSVHAQRISTLEKDKVVVTFNDITELENYQSKLEDEVKKKTDSLMEKEKIMLAQSRQAAMGDMISMIAHQWRQPITAIGMGAQNMQLDIELEDIDSKRFDTKLTKIVKQTQFLSKTIDDFRDFLKPNKKPVKCMVSKIIEDTLTIIGKSLENNNIMLKRNFKADVEIITFSSEVIQVLMNIINNSKDIIKIKEPKEGGFISVEIDIDEENAYINISDNAGGIAEDIFPRIFEPYFTTKENTGGTGLGLYMSKMIVEKHLKGTISVKNLNGGACFTIALPLFEKHNN